MRAIIVIPLLISLVSHPFVFAVDTFKKSKLIIQTDDGDSKEVDVLLVFEEDRLEIKDKKGRNILKTFEYESVKSADYSHSKHPRWKSGAGVAVVIGIFAIPLFFMKGKKHWLAIQAEEDFAVLKLDKKNYKFINAAFEGYSGVKVVFMDLEDE